MGRHGQTLACTCCPVGGNPALETRARSQCPSLPERRPGEYCRTESCSTLMGVHTDQPLGVVCGHTVLLNR